MASHHVRLPKARRRLYVPQIAQINPYSSRARRLVHKRTDSNPAACQDRCTPTDCGDNHMLFFVGIVIVLIAVVIIPRMRVPGGVNSASLGWMSERWLAEHRTSHAE